MSSSDDDEGLTSPDQPPLHPKPSDLSSDEFPLTDLMMMGVFPKEEGQVQSGALEDYGKTSAQSSLEGPGAFRSSISWALAAAMQSQLFGDFGVSSWKSSARKMPEMASGRRGGKPSHLPHASPLKKVLQEKKPLCGSVSKIVLGRKSQGHVSGCPPGPATFPPISGLPIVGIAQKSSLVPLDLKQLKPNARKKPVVSRTKEPELIVQENTKAKKDPVPKGQLPSSDPESFCLCVHHVVGSNGGSKTKTSQTAGNAQLLAMAQGGARPRVPQLSGDQEPPLHIPQQERNEPPPGAWTCPRCSVLQKEIDSLKDQIESMQRVIDKFQAL